ncbi:peptide chain release factor N(5)-glutamine methyltransferase [Tardiphaga alba]|uniref:Release factor glutamine methyltransferase n=1 Tax=Tardiphaga alba TaxID=340268 RepID=A0ABX8AGE5_9BRAD|nr:peptide chain release factor N(5)-glutamine methyltransferase [Tardiphaga alba]
MDFTGQTVEAARRSLTNLLRASLIDSPELDARLLVGAALNFDLTGLISAAKRTLSPDEAAQLAQFAARRLYGEPIARITGIKEFWGLQFTLSADTLVPRPDTETIVEAALECLDTRGPRSRALRIADLGTGSGAIILALLSELPNATGIATDINFAALRAARGNAERNGLAHRTHFVACDYASALHEGFDLIVSNPPYIPSADIAGLDIEVRAHDPMRALDGGSDGYDAYRIIAPEAARLLSPGGFLVVEVGHDQSDTVADLISEAGLDLPAPAKTDLGGIRRAVMGLKKPR